MKIISHTCESCGTVVAANELESKRILKCPGYNCNKILEFTDLSEEERKYFLDNISKYQI
nr:hypothetical protein [Halomicroarcula sp. XH51]